MQAHELDPRAALRLAAGRLGRVDGLPCVEPTGQRRDEQPDHLVTDELVDDRLVADQDIGSGGIEAIEQRPVAAGRHRLGERRRSHGKHLGLDAGQLGEAGSKTEVLALNDPPPRGDSRKIEDEGGNSAEQIVEFLAEKRLI